MTTNQTYIITTGEIAGNPLSITNEVNTFIRNGIALGYINFDIKPVIAVQQFLLAIPTPPSITPGLTATGQSLYTVQINYYDPSIEG